MFNYKYKNSRERKKAIARSNQKYKNEKQTAFTIRFHNVNDKDVIEKLKACPSKTDYIRKLIRDDIQ